MADKADYEGRFAKLLDDMQKLIEDAARAEPEAAEELRDSFEATAPMMDSVSDVLGEIDEAVKDEAGADE